MTKAVRIEKTGAPEVMQLVAVDLARPGSGEVRLRQTAIGLNYIDTYHRSGLYPVKLPSGLGNEAAGVVEEVGQGVTSLKVGDRVVIDGVQRLRPWLMATGPLAPMPRREIFRPRASSKFQQR